jgi:hypothetical protein
VLLDALTGEERAKQDWSLSSSAVRYELVQNGNFLTCIDNKIRLFSGEFQLLREVELAPLGICSRLVYLAVCGVSPSRRSILVSSISRQERISEILDTRALTAISTANEDKSVTITAISDHWLVGLCGNPWEVCIRKVDGSWKAFRFAGPENQPTRVLGRAYFVNDETVLICRLNEMAVANVDGSVIFRVNLPKDRSCENSLPATSSEGGRFAMMENRQLGIDEFFDMGPFWTDDRILVYDVSEQRAVFAVKVNGASQWPSSRTHSNEFALSPDGKRLAVVSDGILNVYKLPDRQAAR